MDLILSLLALLAGAGLMEFFIRDTTLCAPEDEYPLGIRKIDLAEDNWSPSLNQIGLPGSRF